MYGCCIDFMIPSETDPFFNSTAVQRNTVASRCCLSPSSYINVAII